MILWAGLPVIGHPPGHHTTCTAAEKHSENVCLILDVSCPARTFGSTLFNSRERYNNYGTRDWSVNASFVQLVYVPHGWGHAVINLEPSVALTLNFVVERDLRECFQRTKADYPELAQEWEKAIGRLRPELSVHLT